MAESQTSTLILVSLVWDQYHKPVWFSITKIEKNRSLTAYVITPFSA